MKPFRPTAHIYDLVYSHLDYPGHAAKVEGIIRARHPNVDSLLDVACGTGVHLGIWKDRFHRVEGVDIDRAMLDVARERLPEVELSEADFTDFDLGRTFGAVTCMFSSIGYAVSEEGLVAACSAMARHLEPGGVLVVEPWLQPGMIKPPAVRLHTVERDDVVVARSSRLAHDGEVSDMVMDYLVTTAEGTNLYSERHVMGTFTADQYVDALISAGLAAEFDPVGTFLERGLAIGVKGT